MFGIYTQANLDLDWSDDGLFVLAALPDVSEPLRMNPDTPDSFRSDGVTGILQEDMPFYAEEIATTGDVDCYDFMAVAGEEVRFVIQMGTLDRASIRVRFSGVTQTQRVIDDFFEFNEVSFTPRFTGQYFFCIRTTGLGETGTYAIAQVSQFQIEIEGLTDGDDVVVGTSRSELINSGGGNDTIRAGFGTNIINAGEGDDTIFDEIGTNIVDGGAGFDSFVMDEGEFAARNVDLATGVLTDSDGFSSATTLTSIEQVIGTDFDNTLSGGAAGETLVGRGGDDVLRGREGADTLEGGAGDDMLFGDVVDIVSAGTAEAQVFRAYQAVLNRAPDEGGYRAFSDAVRVGSLSQADLVGQLVGSEEFQLTYGELSNRAFVERLYENVLGREGDAQGIAAFTATLDDGRSRTDVVLEFSNSPEFITSISQSAGIFIGSNGATPAEGDVFRLYEAVFDRVPDPGGFTLFVNALQGGVLSVEDIAAEFVLSEEFQLRYGELDTESFVEALYTNVLPGNTDAVGRANFIAAIDGGALTRAQMVAEFATSPELSSRTNAEVQSFVRSIYTENADRLDGGAGADVLFGGRGADTFVFDIGSSERDDILDFVSGQDQIEISGGGDAFDSFAEIVAAGRQSGADAVFDFGEGHVLTLRNVQLDNLTAEDFVLVGVQVQSAQAQAAMTFEWLEPVWVFDVPDDLI